MMFKLKNKYKKIKFLITFVAILAMTGMATLVYADQYTWTERNTSIQQSDWKDIASSADGSVLYAVRRGDSIYRSSDSGSSWSNLTSSGQRLWTSITTSSDGTRVTATVENGTIYYSTDSGANWGASSAPNLNWSSVTSSSDGQYVAAAVAGGYIYYSSSYGASVSQSDSPSAAWSSLAYRSGGSDVIYATINGGQIYKSTNSGNSWTNLGTDNHFWTSITTSADGTRVAATVYNGYVYTSTDAGATWMQRSGSGSNPWTSITSSSDGTRIAATYNDGGNGYVSISTDGGVTWSQESSSPGSKFWNSVAYSSSGEKLAAMSSNSYIYTSIDDVDPSTPAIPDLEPGSDTGASNSDNITNSTTPTFDVDSCENGATVYVAYNSAGENTIGSATCAYGTAVITASTLTEGTYALYTYQIDSVNNRSSDSSTLSITVDTTAASAPGTPDLTTDTGSSATDNITNNTTPQFFSSSGCLINHFVNLYADGSQVGAFTCDGTGITEYTINSSVLSEGEYSMTAKLEDLAGNISVASSNLNILILTTPPTTSGAPDMTSGTDSGSSSTDNITSDTTPDFTGSCTDGNTVILYDDGVANGSAGTCSGSTFSITMATVLASGSNSITFKETDVAGNVSSASTALSVTIDNTAPVLSSVTPTASTSINNVTSSSDISFTTNEFLASGSIVITRTSGTADASSPRTCTLTGTARNSGAHTTFNLSDTTNGCVSNVSSLVSGTVYTFVFAGADTAGNNATSITRTGVTFDNTSPTITNVSSDKTNGSYTVGEVIDIDVTFSEAVTSTGNITVTLETGATDRTCTFTVSGATTGTCNYTVQSSDTTSDLTVSTITGTIADTAGNAMSNFAPATNLAANKALVIDTTAPSSSSISVGSLTTSSAIITWSTSETASSSVNYGLTGSYGSVATSTATSSHSVLLSGLSDGTVYYYNVFAIDIAGNLSTSTGSTFTTTTIVSDTGSTQSVSPVAYASGGGGFWGAGIPFAPNLVNQGQNDRALVWNTVNSSKPLDSNVSLVGLPTQKQVFVSSEGKFVQFNKNLFVGVPQNPDTKKLQVFLNTLGFLVATKGPGSIGKETNLYGPATKNALLKFQKEFGIKGANGVFGPTTRTLVNSILKGL